MNFKDSGKIKQIWILTTPLIVPMTDDPDKETSAQLISRQEKFLKLSQGIKKKLSSIETSQKIQAIGQKYGFELLRLANITRLIREYYFGEVRLENFPAEIEKRMGVNLLTAQEIARYIKSEIINWDPWGEYIAKLPKMPIREIVAKHPKIADIEITADYIELRNPARNVSHSDAGGSEDLSDPTIKNWLQDYISHLGYAKHSQMDRTQYIFHSENAKNLSSPDREKLGIILRSFDENIPLPVDEENGEIVFEGLISEQAPTNIARAQPAPQPSFAPPSGTTAGKQESFIKPYSPIQQPQKQVSRPAPAPAPVRPPQNFIKPIVLQLNRQAIPPSRIAPPARNAAPARSAASAAGWPNAAGGQSEAGKEIDKYFNAPESPDIPPLKIHSITEHNEPKAAPRSVPKQNIQRPAPPQPAPMPRPKYKIIDPFGPRIVEPKLDGNIVDLSGGE